MAFASFFFSRPGDFQCVCVCRKQSVANWQTDSSALHDSLLVVLSFSPVDSRSAESIDLCRDIPPAPNDFAEKMRFFLYFPTVSESRFLFYLRLS